MKTTIERAAFLKSLNHVQSVVERRNTIPILSNLLVEASGGAIALTSTDLDVEIVEKVEATVLDDGATTVPAHTLYDIVRKLPEGAQIQLENEADEARLSLSAGRSRFSLPCLPSNDYPAMADEEYSHQFSMAPEALIRLIDQTKFAISTEETRYYLNGIYLHPDDSDGSMLRAVATDGHRLARVQAPLPDGAAGMPGVIVPRKTVTEVRRLIDDIEEPIKVSVSDSKIRFEFGSSVLTSKLIDGTFPDYGRVIPVGNDKELTVEGRDFAQAVDRVSTISTEKSRAIKLTLDDGRIALAVNNAENGSASEELSVDYASEGLEIGFNSRYLLDVMGQINSGTARFIFADAGSPTIICDAEDSDQNALYVLMPMRV
jgi:DNA polymerase-3 subunit beta